MMDGLCIVLCYNTEGNTIISRGRDPTDDECFEMGQSNSEYSRHWFFGEKMIIDGIEKPKTLFQLVKDTLQIGRPAYRIDVGGGAASSRVQSKGNIDLDFDAVQHGDAEIRREKPYCFGL